MPAPDARSVNAQVRAGAPALKGGEHVSRKEIAALEKVFAAEINDRLPFQSRARVFQALCATGHLEIGNRTFGVGERFPVTVTGYVLTHAGRMAYCESCDDAMPEDTQ